MTDEKYERPAGNLAATFFDPAGHTMPYVQFRYVPKKIFNNIVGQV